jgi:hypothetical protein
MVMAEEQALRDVLPKSAQGRAAPWADRLQRFKPGALRGRMDAHTLGRAMIDRNKEGHLALLPGERRRHIGPPHGVNVSGDNRPIMGFRAMRVPLPRWSQPLVGPHQAQDPAR